MTGPRMVAPALLIGLGLAFGLIATANGAGYRYGVSDQAFYIPVVVRSIDPTLFPRDASLIDAQGHLMATDEILATLIRTNGHLTRNALPRLLSHLVGVDVDRADVDRPACLSQSMGTGRARRGAHAPPSHSRNECQLVRAVFPSTHARVRAWHARRRRPSCAVVRGRRLRG